MFEDLFWWPRIVNAASSLPKEALIAAAAYFAVTDIHKRHTCAKVKRELQQNGTTIETA